ncbi:SDR family NAD(P)-dependent oxidoreductase [Microbacterium sp. WCS2018Hpa-23]|uniref:SDR family NAD(P)-dependent oxidoreductase n=1 Tax=Microbacterium sp. WCS2018Hpa-23 TaxID=3073634 RepID=UPI002882E616|nr:SDR family NAD(P)-dependent oxidoreductase [Microbacterium sp. WCS2018Hpa-23]
MSGSLARQHILVTGGGSGIARAAAERYHAEGACVTILERSASHANDVVSGSGGAIRSIVGDAMDPEVLASAVELASDSGGALHHLTCGVGIFDFYAQIHELSPDDLVAAAGESWRMNVLSALLAVNIAHSSLARGAGSITLTVSESAFNAVGGGVLYGSSKWAVRGMVEHLAAELAPLRVNGVAPGGTSGTRFGGLVALGQTASADAVEGRDQRIARATLLGITADPIDHAGAYRFLADPVDARAVTGMIIRSDAGRRM